MKKLLLILIISLIGFNQVYSQSFAAPDTTNLFGIRNLEEVFPTFGDLDNDGDYDLLLCTEDYPVYYKNIGTPNNPQFDSTDVSVLGLSDTLEEFFVKLIDLDNDSDLDLFWISDTAYVFIENIGSATTPHFDLINATPNPFGLNSQFQSLFDFVDIDGDGDFDFMVKDYNDLFFVENIGSSISPQFDIMNSIINPFGLNTNIHGLPVFADIDNDGDFDLFTSTYNADIRFYENIGTNIQAQFTSYILNPFSIQNYNDDYSLCEFVDLDNDGDLDLMISGDGLLQYLENLTIVNAITETQNPNNNLLKITDLLGRETKGTKNEVLFYIYDDGTVEKRIVVE